jgi:hypothetical protein
VPRPAEVLKERRVGEARLFKGIREYGEAGGVQRAGREFPFGVGRFGKTGDEAPGPGEQGS